jgi:hypothetical protein
VSKFISIPGVSPRSNDGRGGVPIREALRRRHPEYYASKDQGPPVTGFQPGEDISFRGDPARVIGEEHDAHTGTVEQWIQRSSAADSGTYKATWTPTTEGGSTMAITRLKKVTE